MGSWSDRVSCQARVVGLGLSVLVSAAVAGGLPAVALAEGDGDPVDSVDPAPVAEVPAEAPEPVAAPSGDEGVIELPAASGQTATELTVGGETAADAIEAAPQADAADSQGAAVEVPADTPEEAVATETDADAGGAEAQEEPAAGADEVAPAPSAAAQVAETEAAADEGTTTGEDAVPAVAPAKAPAAAEDPDQASATTSASKVTYSNMYRLYNPWSGQHLYTASLEEAQSISRLGWKWEGVGWVAPSEGDAVWRLYNPWSGDHHFTMSRGEYDFLATLGWRQEGIGWRSDPSKGVAVWREFNPYETVGTHNYTTSKAEDAQLASLGWKSEGIAWYGSDHATLPIAGFWLVQDTVSSGRQRYWIGSDGKLAQGRLVDPTTSRDAGAGYYAYATSGGEVVRGARAVSGVGVYLADNDGRLEGTGWLVTDRYYAPGQLQRYYVDPSTHAARVGYFTVDGDRFYGIPEKGYVARWTMTVDGRTIVPDNEGVLVPRIVATVAAGDGTTTTVEVADVNGTSYLFLPSYADLRTVALKGLRANAEVPLLVSLRGRNSFSAVPAGGLASLGAARDARGALLLDYRLGQTGVVRQLDVMVSGKVSSVYVISSNPSGAGRAWVEADSKHNRKASVTVIVVDPDGKVVYDEDDASEGKLSTIKGRGNYTWTLAEKRPYQISLSKKADLLETGSKDNRNKKWVLLANLADTVLYRNAMAYDLGLELGLKGTESAPVDLYYDGEYRGSYQLCEKVEVKSGRVDVEDLEGEIEDANPGVDLDAASTAKGRNRYGYEYQYCVGVKDPSDTTGGYLLELDNAYYASEKCWFRTSLGTFVVKSPEVASERCIRYISECVQEAIRKHEAGTYNQGVSFDLDSLAKTYLVNELFKNVDSFNSSTYFYKDAGDDVIYAGPLWDFDTSVTRYVEGISSNRYTYWGYGVDYAFPWVGGRTTLQRRARALWESQVSPLVHDVLLGSASATGSKGHLRSTSGYRAEVAASERMDEALHGHTSHPGTLGTFGSYAADASYVDAWLGMRAAWLDSYLLRVGSTNPSVTSGGVDYGVVFDPYYYLDHNPDVAKAYGRSASGALQHFVTYGMAEGRRGSMNFDVQTYRSRYADLRAAFGDDLAAYYRHFVQYGFFEGRSAV